MSKKREKHPKTVSDTLAHWTAMAFRCSSLRGGARKFHGPWQLLGQKRVNLDFLENFPASWTVSKWWHVHIVRLFPTIILLDILYSYWRYLLTHFRVKIMMETCVFWLNKLFGPWDACILTFTSDLNSFKMISRRHHCVLSQWKKGKNYIYINIYWRHVTNFLFANTIWRNCTKS